MFYTPYCNGDVYVYVRTQLDILWVLVNSFTARKDNYSEEWLAKWQLWQQQIDAPFNCCVTSMVIEGLTNLVSYSLNKSQLYKSLHITPVCPLLVLDGMANLQQYRCGPDIHLCSMWPTDCAMQSEFHLLILLSSLQPAITKKSSMA